jgi:hypothetical protein
VAMIPMTLTRLLNALHPMTLELLGLETREYGYDAFFSFYKLFSCSTFGWTASIKETTTAKLFFPASNLGDDTITYFVTLIIAWDNEDKVLSISGNQKQIFTPAQQYFRFSYLEM